MDGKWFLSVAKLFPKIFTVVEWEELIDTLVDPGIIFVQLVNLLLSKGASVSAKDKKERQAIHWAAYLGK